MEVDIEQLKTWIAALRSGEYKQSTKALQNEIGYCCLGVACAVLIPKELQMVNDGILSGGAPQSQPNAPEWLKEINGHFRLINGKSLLHLNDEKNYHFQK